MILVTEPILIDVRHHYIDQYSINGLTLTESDGTTIAFKSYPEMAKYLGLSKQGLYNKIRVNMNPIDKIMDSIEKNRKWKYK
jgi:hypothetical protein